MAQLLFPALLFLAMWFLLIRPQQARVRRQRQLLGSLQVGDEVVTAGGLVGVIRDLSGEEARIEVAPGVEVRMLRAAISRTVEPAEPEVAEPGSPEAA